jgi:hypothetical protein
MAIRAQLQKTVTEIHDLFDNQDHLIEDMSGTLARSQQEDFVQNMQMNQILTHNEELETEN